MTLITSDGKGEEKCSRPNENRWKANKTRHSGREKDSDLTCRPGWGGDAGDSATQKKKDRREQSDGVVDA